MGKALAKRGFVGTILWENPIKYRVASGAKGSVQGDIDVLVFVKEELDNIYYDHVTIGH